MGGPHSTFRDYKPSSAQSRQPGYSRAPWFMLGVGIPLMLLTVVMLLPESSGKTAEQGSKSAALPDETINARESAAPVVAEAIPGEAPDGSSFTGVVCRRTGTGAARRAT